jgi:hypothetical protein
MTSGRMQHTEIQKKKETKNEKQTEGRWMTKINKTETEQNKSNKLMTEI